MTPTRRDALRGLSALGLAAGAPGAPRASPAWPTGTVRIVVPFAAGALTDLAARSIGAVLSTQLCQQFVV